MDVRGRGEVGADRGGRERHLRVVLHPHLGHVGHVRAQVDGAGEGIERDRAGGVGDVARRLADGQRHQRPRPGGHRGQRADRGPLGVVRVGEQAVRAGRVDEAAAGHVLRDVHVQHVRLDRAEQLPPADDRPGMDAGGELDVPVLQVGAPRALLGEDVEVVGLHVCARCRTAWRTRAPGRAGPRCRRRCGPGRAARRSCRGSGAPTAVGANGQPPGGGCRAEAAGIDAPQREGLVEGRARGGVGRPASSSRRAAAASSCVAGAVAGGGEATMRTGALGRERCACLACLRPRGRGWRRGCGRPTRHRPSPQVLRVVNRAVVGAEDVRERRRCDDDACRERGGAEEGEGDDPGHGGQAGPVVSSTVRGRLAVTLPGEPPPRSAAAG